jgi:uroporphyrinogen decarboxylase
MNLEEPDRVPFDLELSDEPFQAMCKYYNIKDHSVSRFFTYGIKLSRALQCDLLAFEAGPPEGWSPKRFGDGSYVDEWGILRRFRMKGTIDWFENHPIKDSEDLENYEFPDPTAHGRLLDLELALKKYHEEFAVLGGIGFSLWERLWTLHGFEKSLMDLYRNPKFIEKFLDRIVEFDLELAKIIVEHDVDAFRLGDDYGSQKDLLIPPEKWRRFIKPRLSKITSVARKKGLPVVLHTCGNVSRILKDLSEAGITVLNPIQPKAMDPAELKQRFGHLFCFYGTLDLQQTLPFGKPEDVKNEVEKRIRTVGTGGGLILAPAHTLPPGVPIQNLLSLVDAMKGLSIYSPS